ncbi:MAG: hypothetical protein KKA41_17275 [Proteobacteria bacterium]|nr:hypothetical protein [Pseudomonadota bacterium]
MKNTKLKSRIFKILLLIIIPLLIVSAILLSYDLLVGKVEGITRQIVFSFVIIFLIIFVTYITLILTIHEKKFAEYGSRVSYLRPFGIFLASVMIFFSVTEILIYNNFSVCFIIPIAILLFYNLNKNKGLK